jgi:hypothetical protein
VSERVFSEKSSEKISAAYGKTIETQTKPFYERVIFSP